MPLFPAEIRSCTNFVPSAVIWSFETFFCHGFFLWFMYIHWADKSFIRRRKNIWYKIPHLFQQTNDIFFTFCRKVNSKLRLRTKKTQVDECNASTVCIYTFRFISAKSFMYFIHYYHSLLKTGGKTRLDLITNCKFTLDLGHHLLVTFLSKEGKTTVKMKRPKGISRVGKKVNFCNLLNPDRCNLLSLRFQFFPFNGKKIFYVQFTDYNINY